MTAGPFIDDRKIRKGTAAKSGGTFVVTLTQGTDFPNERLLFLRAKAFLTALSGGHLHDVAAYTCEGWVSCKNAVTALVDPITGSTNPLDSTQLAVLVPPQVADATMLGLAGGAGSLIMRTGSGTIVFTTTNASATVNADVTIFIELFEAESI